MKSKFAWISIIVFGMILFGMPVVYADDVDDMERERDQAEAAYEQIVDDQSFDLEEDIFKLGDTFRDYVFSPVKPCRIIDTRLAGGKIPSGGSRAFYVYGDGGAMAGQGGNPAGCFSPRAGEPRAVHINIVAVNSVGNGWLTVWPTGTNMPLAGVLNYYPNRTDPISNAFTVQTGVDVGRDINVYAKNETHVVADVMGYYYDVNSVFIDRDFEASEEGNDPSATLQFLAEPARVTVERAGQHIYVSSNKALGAGNTAAASLDLWICHRKVGVAALTKVGDGVYDNRVPANTRVTMGLSAIIEDLAPGTYDVGLCGEDDGNGNWTSNEYGYTSAFVFE